MSYFKLRKELVFIFFVSVFSVYMLSQYFPIRHMIIIDYNYWAVSYANSFSELFKIIAEAKNLSPLLSVIIFLYFKVVNLSQQQITNFYSLILFLFIFINMTFVARLKNIYYAMIFTSILIFSNSILLDSGFFSANIIFVTLLSLRMFVDEKENNIFIEVLNGLIISVHFLGIAFYFSQVLFNSEKKLKHKLFLSAAAILLFVLIYKKIIFSYNIAPVSPLLISNMIYNFASVHEFMVVSFCVLLFYSIKIYQYLKKSVLKFDRGSQLLLSVVLNLILSYALLHIYNPVLRQPMRYVHYIYCVLLLQFIFDFSFELNKVIAASAFKKIFYVNIFVVVFSGLAIKNNLEFYNYTYSKSDGPDRLYLQTINDQLVSTNLSKKINIIVDSNSCSGLENIFTIKNKFTILCLTKDQNSNDKIHQFKNLANSILGNFYYLDTNNYFQETSTADLELQGYSSVILLNKNFYTLVEYIKK